MATPGVILIPVSGADEARELFERIAAGQTYLVGTEVYPDNDDDWWNRVGFTMSYETFWDRFGPGTPQPNGDTNVKVLERVSKFIGVGGTDADDPHRSKREALKSLADVEAARERLENINRRVTELQSRPLSHGEAKELAALHEQHRAATTNVLLAAQENENRRSYASISLADAKHVTVEEFKEAIAKRKHIIDRLRTNHEKSASLKAAVRSSKVNVANAPATSRANVTAELDGNERQLASWHREKDRLLSDLAKNEPLIRAAHDARCDADDAISDFCDCPRRHRKSVESFLRLPEFLTVEAGELAGV